MKGRKEYTDRVRRLGCYRGRRCIGLSVGSSEHPSGDIQDMGIFSWTCRVFRSRCLLQILGLSVCWKSVDHIHKNTKQALYQLNYRRRCMSRSNPGRRIQTRDIIASFLDGVTRLPFILCQYRVFFCGKNPLLSGVRSWGNAHHGNCHALRCDLWGEWFTICENGSILAANDATMNWVLLNQSDPGGRLTANGIQMANIKTLSSVRTEGSLQCYFHIIIFAVSKFIDRPRETDGSV